MPSTRNFHFSINIVMSFAMDSELQGFELYPPVLRNNQPLPSLPSPPNIMSRFLANIKSKLFKIRQRVAARAAALTAARKNAKAPWMVQGRRRQRRTQ